MNMEGKLPVGRVHGGYIVKRQPGHIHETFAEAGEEAARLTMMYGEPPFMVLKIVAQAGDQGDVTRFGHDGSPVSLEPDINAVRQMIGRVVDSLADDPEERATIAASAALEFIAREQGPVAAKVALRRVAGESR